MGFNHSASTIAEISGLQTALDGKSALGHTHTFASLTSKPTTLAGYGITDGQTQAQTDALYSALSHTHTFASLTSKPTTIAGYGITDFNSLGDARWATLAHNQAWSTITSTPTTIAGYGITDFNSLGDARWSLTSHTHTFASLTSKPTDLSGYGITDAYTKTAADARYGLVGQANTWAGGQTMNTTSGPSLTAGLSGALTATTANAILMKHNTSGTAAAGFGTTIAFQGDTTTTQNRDMAQVACTWGSAVDAARKGQIALITYGGASTFESLRVTNTGVAASIGFLGASAIGRQTISGSRGSATATVLGDLLTALASFGLITNSTSA